MRPRLSALGIALALILLGCLCLSTPAPASPTRPSQSKPGTGQRSSAPPRAQRPTRANSGETASSRGPAAGSGTGELAGSGQVDPLSGLGIRNPLCDQLAQIRDRQTRLACEANGTPETSYPASNYGFDVFITTGITHPLGDIAYGFATVLNGIWLGLVFCLKLIFELLGLAFGLNPFAEGQTMSAISAAVARLYAEITDPWLSVLIVCAGIWFAYKGLLRREVAAGLAGTLAGIAMLIFGLWVVHQPRESVGRLAALSDQMALSVIAAPQSGSISRPAGSFAEATSRAWARLVEVPFAGLEFSDVRWALRPPPPEAVRIADQHFCADVGTLAILAVLSQLGNAQASEACAGFARRRYGPPRRLIDLYLRSSPGSPARQALWDYFNGSERYKPKVAAQGQSGVLTRLSMLALFAIGLLGAMLLLAWLAIRLFTQAAIAFVLLLAAPFALFFPLLGDSGRRAFKTWALTLIGACLAKLIYAAFLSIVLAGIAILASSGATTGFLLACAFSWAVFLKRTQLVDWLSIGEADRHAAHGMAAAGIGALAIGRRLSRGGQGMVGGAAQGAARWSRARGAERAAATRITASEALRGRARALADARHGEARRLIAEFEARHGRPGDPHQPSRSTSAPGERIGDRTGAPAAAAEEERGRYRQARELLARVERNERRTGARWSERDLDRFAAEDLELLRSSRDPADHAHRAGLDRASFEALRGPERERAEEAIQRATARDRQRLEAAAEPPGRIVGRPRELLERARQHRDGEASARREQLRRLRRERRSPAPHVRRNLSRGA